MFKPSTRLLATVGAVLMAGAIALPASTSWASRGDCSQPATGGANPVATDCLFILRAAVGSSTCTESCICDTSGDLRVSATDALICLLDTVGATVDLNCPCGGRVDLQDDDYLFDADVDVVDADIRSRFVDTNYIGAFPQDEDPATGDWTVGWTISLHGNKTVWEPASGGTLAGGVPSADGSCPAGTTDIGDTALPAGFAGTMDICQLAARYDTDSQTITLTNDNVYRLGGTASQGTLIGDGDAEDVVPGTAAHVTLTIEPGTLILGTSAEALAITRGSDIFVNGTADDPVVMSSVTWFNDWLAGSDGTSGFGEWGGLVVTGFGTANQCNDVVSCDALVEGYLNPFNYGGLDNSDDSGSISYLVIRQGGFDLDGNGSELNGLTLYTVGYNTEISYVQVHQNDDDGIEFFGGKVVVDHAVVTETGDDSLDTDLGFGGGVQFAVVKQGRTAADRGMETDSSPNPSDTPVSQPTWANITILGNTGGPDDSTTGVILRSTTGGFLWNGIITGSARSCIRLDDSTLSTRGGTLGDPDDGILQIHNYVVGCDTNFEGEDGVGGNEDADVETWYFADANNRAVDPRLGATGYPTSPDLFGPEFAFDPSDLTEADIQSRFVATDYAGAFDQASNPSVGDWTDGWTIDLHGNNTVWEPASGGTLAGGVPSANGSCPAGTTDIGDTPLPNGFAGTMDICQLAARYDTDGQTITLTNDNVYRLGGTASQGTLIGDGDAAGVTPGTAANVTLVIEPGTLVLGTSAEALAITRGSDIFINGTEEDPVVMSSLTWFNDWLAGSDGTSGRGEWGGLVVTGFGEANQCNNLVSCDALVEGYLNPFNYGGFDNTDDSGSISYLVIRQGGFDLDGNGSELNGLTLYTIGHNTEISYVQVHQNDDDGIEFFGGQVVVDHAVLTGVGDDSLDSDLGFTGGVQFAVVVQDDEQADRGMEADSSPNPSDTPVSVPAYVNFTIVGSAGGAGDSTTGIILRSTTGGELWNGIVTGSARSCIRLDDSTLSTRAGALGDPDDGSLRIHNTVVSCDTNFEGETGVAGNEDADVQTWFDADPGNVEVDPNLNGFGYPSPPNP